MKTELTDVEIVAEFDGLEWDEKIHAWYKNDRKVEFGVETQSLKYDKDWNWLIPVCAKWDDIDGLMHNPEYSKLCDYLDNAVTLYQIEFAFTVLVENIKWYNTNQTK